METIGVQCQAEPGGWACRVTVGDGRPTTHEVRVTPAELEGLTPGASDPTDLVRRSFVFLLEREPKESILGSFDLAMIGRYFPQYEQTIRGM